MHTLGSLFVVLTSVASAACHVLQTRASPSSYALAKEYSGEDFFDGWDYYGAPDLLLNGMFPHLLSMHVGSLGLTAGHQVM